MTGPTREQVEAWAQDIGLIDHRDMKADFMESLIDDMERFASLAYAAGQGAQATMQPPTPLVVDMSKIDKDMLRDLMSRPHHVGVLQPVQDDAIAAAVAAEREACAKVCEGLVDTHPEDEFDPWSECATSCAAAIRARGAE